MMTPISNNYNRILHEYEISDNSGLHFASIVYLREINCNNSNISLCDNVDAIMQNIIQKNCHVCNRNQPVTLSSKEEVDALDKRLSNEFQLKAYFTFFTVPNGVGKDIDCSYITIHATILVKNESDVPYFNNIGFAYQASYNDIMTFTFFSHTPSPVYTLQEHPLVHGIVCYKDATDGNIIYLLYRHNDNLQESIIAIVNLNNNFVDFLLGTEPNDQNDILLLSQALVSQNNYAPLYRYKISKGLGYCVPITLKLNKERDKFKEAQNIVIAELSKTSNGIVYANDMAAYLKMMKEA